MKNIKFFRALSLCAAMMLSGQAYAATSFEDPASASWGGWTRGDSGTAHVHWDAISWDAPGYDGSPDIANVNSLASGLVANNSGALITGSSNVYSFSDTPDFSTYFQPVSAPVGPVTAALQLFVTGTPLDISSVTMNLGGIATAFDSMTTLFSGIVSSSFGDVEGSELLFLWTLPSAESFYQFDFNALGAHMSLAEVSLDVGPAAVPVPAAVWLFASALIGLIGVRRRPTLVA
jgi:hypothetical protein